MFINVHPKPDKERTEQPFGCFVFLCLKRQKMKHDLAIITMDGKYLKTTVDGYNINDSWLCYWTNNPYSEIMINKDSIFRLEIRKSII